MTVFHLMRYLFILIFTFLTLQVISAQGTIKGRISDVNGESLIGVTIILKSNQTIGTVTDYDGNYSLKVPLNSPQSIVIKYIGYATIEEPITLSQNQIVVKDFVMSDTSTALVEVEIVAKKEKDRTYYMESIKKKSANTIDYVSSQSMKLTGDNNAASALARVTGVSTNGSFITVRGIGDRYVKTSINGMQIPTLDPFTNNIKLDLIPSSLIDNIMITKTASPELSGAWTGAYISVETKDFPEKFSFLWETQVGYNAQTSFKDVLVNQTSSTDWLGFDHNFRDHDHTSFVNANPDPTRYQEFVALGLSNFYKSLGVTSSWKEGTTVGENYFKLGLVELGLLPKAFFNDAQAFEKAKQLYVSGGYKDKAYEVINSSAGQSGRSFPNNWNTFTKKAPLNFSQSFSLGNLTRLWNRELGYYGGFRYGSSVQFDPNARSQRTILSELDSLGNPLTDADVAFDNVKYVNGWSALLSLAYKFNSNHSLSLLYMPNFIGINSLRDGIGYGDIIYKYEIAKSQFYEQRKQIVYQLKSEHYFPKTKLKMDINASYSQGNSSAPDFKKLEFFANDDFVYFYDKTKSYINRDFRYLSEDIFDSKLVFELPLGNQPGIARKIKFGGAFQRIDKIYDQFNYNLNFNNVSPYITNNDLDTYFASNRFDVVTSNSGGTDHKSLDFYYGRPDVAANHTFGLSNISSGFVLLDYTLFKSLRVSGGLRVEHTDLRTDAIEYDKLKYKRDDPRRVGLGQSFIFNPGSLNSVDYLPSINVIYKIKQDDIAPINLRLNYGRSIARPSLREYSEAIVFDYELNSQVIGNSLLKIVEIDNYDIRFESYFKSGNNISLSLFYKNFKNHIELVQGYTWTNALESRVFGLELDGRVQLFKGCDFKANVSLVDSKTNIEINQLTIYNFVRTWTPKDTITRTMYGQAPFVVNGILSYNFEKIGLVSTIGYNIQGPRLVLTSFGTAPDVYELPRHLLDFKISKSIGKHLALSISIKDILDSPIRRSYKYKEGFILDFDRYQYGTNYVLGISYKI